MQEEMYSVIASVRNDRGTLDTYPVIFATLEEAKAEFNKQIESNEDWYSLVIMQGDDLIDRVILDRKGPEGNEDN